MKKTLIAFALSALSVMSCVSQGVKISNEPNASTPLAGSEIMLVNQGGVTKIANVAQVIQAATAQDTATTNALAALRAADLAVSNGFVNVSNSYVATAVTVAAIPAGIASSNFLNSGQVKSSNFLSSAQVASSNFLSNVQVASSNFQNAAQVSSSISSAVTAATVGAVQSGGVANLGALQVTNLITPTIFLPDQAVSSPSFYFVDCTKGNYFEIKASATSPNAFSLGLTNMTDGQQITVLFKVKPGSSAISFNNLSVFSVANYGANITAQNTTSGDTWYLNWIDINNNVIFSGAKL